MAVPKKKTSKQRKRLRRSHHHLPTPPQGLCPRCGQPGPPHAVCESCGFYKGIEVLHEKAG
ncbi:MAG: 50S ribosomal protein L32 [Planctomycetota bacterium]